MKKIIAAKEKLAVGIVYLLLCLVMGENHPFSMQPMYSSFPNSAHSFYLSNEDNKLLPIHEFFNYSSEDLAHNYSVISSTTNQNNKLQDSAVGRLMMQLVLPRAYSAAKNFDSLRLHKVTYYLSETDSVFQKDEILYAVAP